MKRGDEMHYSPKELLPVLERVRLAVEVDLRMPGTAQGRLINAWTRVAELRLPRAVAPQIVLDEVERLVNLWDTSRGEGGINRAAFLLSEEETAFEVSRLEWMLQEMERAAGLREA